MCAVWWVTEAIPIPATSLLPFAVFPFVGVLTPGQVGESYGSSLVLLLLGGLILSTSMEKSGAHRRVALTMVNLFGGSSSRRIVFGFMAASAVLSMWISNTATSLMLLPVALAVIEKSEDKELAAPLLLGIAYAASVGGIGTPIGTLTNLVFREVYEQTDRYRDWFSKLDAMGYTRGPGVIAGGWFLDNAQAAFRDPAGNPGGGAWRVEEKRVFIIFAITALAWVTRSQPFGGWSGALDLPGANDASVALLAVIAMFLVSDGKGGRLLDWETAARIPWGMLILFGAGIAIARAFGVSGLGDVLGAQLSGIAAWPLVLVIAVICLSITFMTELTSNAATTALMMPILAAAAIGVGIDPALLMLPAAMSASCAFMLPVATPPNTIAFSAGLFSIDRMAREGFVLNLLGVVVITAICSTLLIRIFG